MSSIDPILLIPFAIGNRSTAESTTSYSPNRTGSSQVLITSFGYGNIAHLGYGIDSVTQQPATFINSSSIVQELTFATATPLTRLNIFAEVYTQTSISQSYNLTPYVALALASPWSDLFKVIPETITPIITTTRFLAQSVYYTSRKDIIVSIPSGSRIAVVCGHTNDTTSTTSSTSTFTFSGGIAFW